MWDPRPIKLVSSIQTSLLCVAGIFYTFPPCTYTQTTPKQNHAYFLLRVWQLVFKAERSQLAAVVSLSNDSFRKPTVVAPGHTAKLAMKQSVKFAQVPKQPNFMWNWYQNVHTDCKQMAAATCKLGSHHQITALQGHTILCNAQGCANVRPYAELQMTYSNTKNTAFSLSWHPLLQPHSS